MSFLNVFQRVSQAPTKPHAGRAPRTFDVADLYRGPVTAQGDTPDSGVRPLDEKFSLSIRRLHLFKTRLARIPQRELFPSLQAVSSSMNHRPQHNGTFQNPCLSLLWSITG